MTYKQEALEAAVLAGKILLHNGAEIYRVQDTIIKMLVNFGITEYNVYVITNAILITIDENGEKPLNCVRNVALGGVHLERIAAVNDISRRVVAENNKNTAEILKMLHECEEIPPKSGFMHYLACGTGASSFCYMLGGSVFDSFAAFLTGLFLQAFLFLSARGRQNKFIVHILGSAWATVCSHALFNMGIGDSMDNMIIGSIIPLVPGVAFVTSIREFFNSDYISGTIRLIDAVLVGVCIAVGVSSAFGIWDVFMGAIM